MNFKGKTGGALPQLISIKGTPKGLVFNFNTKDGEFKDICAQLEEKLLEGGDFFNGATYFLNPQSPFSEGEIRIITEIMHANSLIKGRVEEKKQKTKDPSPSIHPNEDSFICYAQNGDTVLLTRSLRSGQQAAVKGNAVLIGDINIGAELKASGHIIVMGSCRGIVHAGAEGDRNAFIIAYKLIAPQLRIADTSALIAPAPKGFNLPVQKATLEGNTIIVKDYEQAKLKNIAGA